MDDARLAGARGEVVILCTLALVLALEGIGWRLSHRTEAELRASLAAGAPHDQVWSLHILLNRGASPRIDDAQVAALLASGEPLVREMAMTTDVWRLQGWMHTGLQYRHLDEVAEPGEAIRGRYYLKMMGRPVTRAELRAYFRSLARAPGATAAAS